MKRVASLVLAAFCLSGFNFGNETITSCSSLTGTFAAKNELSSYTRVVTIQNTCNQSIVLSDDGSTDGMTLGAGMGGTWEFKDFKKDESAASVTLYVKHAGAAPTAGTLIITVLH